MASINGVSTTPLASNSAQSLADKQLEPVADLFKMSVSDLRTAMKTQTLASIAGKNNVSETDLESTLADTFANATPSGGSQLSSDQAAAIAKAFANGQSGLGTSLAFTSQKTLMDYINDEQSGSGDSSDSDSLVSNLTSAYTPTQSTSSNNLDSLAKALGMSTADLTQKLQSGDTTALRAAIVNAYGSTAGTQFDASL